MKRLSPDVLDVLREHVEAQGSLEESISEFESLGDTVLYLPKRQQETARTLAAELRHWRPQFADGDVTVYHGTSHEQAAFMLENGVIPQMKPWTLAAQRYAYGDYAEFGPGCGVERGIYVTASPSIARDFGRVVLAINTPRQWLAVPAELLSLGYSADDVDFALGTENGAVIKHPLHREMISLTRENPSDPDSFLEQVGAVELDEGGVHFETGVPVRFRYLRGTTTAPYFGGRFGQDIEPAGRYLLHDSFGAHQQHQAGFEFGWVFFESPLVLAFTTTDDEMEPLYGAHGWKARLTEFFGKTGRALSKALVKMGFDGVVTVWITGRTGDTKEIVDLTMFK